MINENDSILSKFDAEINNEGNIIFDIEITKTLFSKGIKNVEVQILTSSKSVAVNENINMKLFNDIKEIQNLTDDVVYNLLKAKGSLINE